MNTRDRILLALHSGYVAERDEACTDLEVFLDNPVGVGDHGDIVKTARAKFEKYESAESKLEMLEMSFPEVGIYED